MNPEVEKILAENRKILEEAKALLADLGIEYNEREWLLDVYYCREYNMTIETLREWIEEGKVPKENIKYFDIMPKRFSIKAESYQ